MYMNIHKICIGGEYKRVEAALDAVCVAYTQVYMLYEGPHVQKNAMSVFARFLHFMYTEATFWCIL